MKPTISFIVPVRNDARRLAACLDSIKNSHPDNPDDVEIVVADNGSEDDSRTVAINAGAKVLELPGLRVAALRNRAAAAASGEILAFVDADHTVAPGWTDVAIADLNDDVVAAAGAPYHAPPAGTWVHRMYDLFRDHRPGIRYVSWLGSGNIAVKRRCFDELSGFDESLETCEDVDFCQRLETAGYRILADSRLASTHFGDPPTLSQLFMSELWRGRDNLKVSLRRRPQASDIPSIAIPILDLALFAAALTWLLVVPRYRMLAVVAAAALVVGLAGLRGFRMVQRSADKSVWTMMQAWAVASVYDVARALALVLGVSHRRARA